MAREVKKLEPLTDDCLMPSGKYKGIRMEEVPAKYLLYMDGQRIPGRVQKYIDKVRVILIEQANQENE